jgi:hypothetical protein
MARKSDVQRDLGDRPVGTDQTSGAPIHASLARKRTLFLETVFTGKILAMVAGAVLRRHQCN